MYVCVCVCVSVCVCVCVSLCVCVCVSLCVYLNLNIYIQISLPAPTKLTAMMMMMMMMMMMIIVFVVWLTNKKHLALFPAETIIVSHCFIIVLQLFYKMPHCFSIETILKQMLDNYKKQLVTLVYSTLQNIL